MLNSVNHDISPKPNNLRFVLSITAENNSFETIRKRDNAIMICAEFVDKNSIPWRFTYEKVRVNPTLKRRSCSSIQLTGEQEGSNNEKGNLGDGGRFDAVVSGKRFG
jgi:hypothetical protein